MRKILPILRGFHVRTKVGGFAGKEAGYAHYNAHIPAAEQAIGINSGAIQPLNNTVRRKIQEAGLHSNFREFERYSLPRYDGEEVRVFVLETQAADLPPYLNYFIEMEKFSLDEDGMYKAAWISANVFSDLETKKFEIYEALLKAEYINEEGLTRPKFYSCKAEDFKLPGIDDKEGVYRRIFNIIKTIQTQQILDRFTHFGWATIELLRRLGPPHFLNLHDWQAGIIPIISRWQTGFNGESPLQNTKFITTIHEFAYDGRFPEECFSTLGLGLRKRDLPQWIEFHEDISILKAALYLSDRSCALTTDQIQNVIASRYHPQFHGIAREMHEEKQGLVALETEHIPGRDFTTDYWIRLARLNNHIYRSVINFVYRGHRKHLPTIPELAPLKKTRLEEIMSNNNLFKELYEKCSAEERRLIKETIESDRTRRFELISSEIEFINLLNFLSIEPKARFEERMIIQGLEEFIQGFNPRDIDRILSIEITLADCKNKAILNEFEGREKVTIYEALDKLDLISHVAGIFTILKDVVIAGEKSEGELAEVLSPLGLEEADNTYLWMSSIYKNIKQQKIRAFLMSVILHDIGKIVSAKEKSHPTNGAKLLGQNKELKKALLTLFNDEELKTIANITNDHMTFGAISIIEPKIVDKTLRAWQTYDEFSDKVAFLESIILLGFLDSLNRGGYNPDGLNKLFRIRKVCKEIADSRQLETELFKVGLGQYERGKARWDNAFRDIKRDTLVREQINGDLRDFLDSKGMSKKAYYTFLGSAAIIPLEDILRVINNPVIKIKLLNWMVEICSTYKKPKEIHFLNLPRDPRFFESQINNFSHVLQHTSFDELDSIVQWDSEEQGKINIILADLAKYLDKPGDEE